MAGSLEFTPEDQNPVIQYSGNFLLDLEEGDLTLSEVQEAIYDENRVVKHDPTGPGLIVVGQTEDHDKVLIVLRESDAPSEPSENPHVWQVLTARPASPVESEIYTKRMDF
jgi:hypothetical protein